MWKHHFPQYKSMGIFRRSMAANSAVSSRIWLNFELLRALIHVIITCKYEKDRIKTAEKKWQHCFFFHNNALCCHGNQSSDLAKFQTHPSTHVCHRYLQVWKGSNQEPLRKRDKAVFPIVTIGSYLLPWKPEFWSDLAQNLMQPFPHPNNASDKI